MAEIAPGVSACEQWLPDPGLWPERIYSLPEFSDYPDPMNSTEELIDAQVDAGRGDHPAILYDDTVITYAELRTEANKFGNALRRLGVAAGDRVILRSLNEPQALIANFGALKLGAIVVPTSPLLGAPQFAHIATDSGASVAVVSLALADAVTRALPDCPGLRHVIVSCDEAGQAEQPGCLSYDKLVAGESPELAPVRRSRTAVAVLLYSSGIGEPARATAHFLEEALIIPDVYGRRGWRVRPDDVIGTTGPISFAGGYSTAATIPYRFGATAAVIPLGRSPSPRFIFDLVRKYGMTLMAGMPTGFRRMLEAPGGSGEDLRTLRAIAGGGEPLTAKTFLDWKARFGHEIYEGFGTNGMMYVFISNAVSRRVRPGSMGTALPGYEIKALTDSGAPAAPGETGQLYARGPVGTLYWGPPGEAAAVQRKQRSAVRDGWVKIGDHVVIDADGYVTFIAREEDLIVNGEDRFGPDAVEQVLREDPAVADAGVIGRGEPGRQHAKAYVVAAEGCVPGPALAAAILGRCAAALTAVQVPAAIEFTAALPRTPYGTRLRRIQWDQWFAAQPRPPAPATIG